MMSNLRKYIICLIVLSVALSFSVEQVWANAWSTYGVNARSIAMARAYASVCDDWGCVYSNPAGIARAEVSQFSLAFYYAAPKLGIDMPGAGYQTQKRHWQSKSEVEELSAEEIGIVLPLQYLFDVELPLPAAIAFGLLLPNHSVFGFRAYENNKLFNVLYNERNNRILINGCLGVGITDWLDVGLGVSFQQKVEGEFGVEMTLEIGEEINVNERTMKATDIVGKYGPLAGINVRPIEELTIALVYRSKFEMVDDETEFYRNIDLGEASLVPGIFESNLNYSIHNVGYTPQNISIGASYLFASLDLKLALEAIWYDWSEYRFVRWRAEPPNRFDDTWYTALGLEWEPTAGGFIRGGVAYEPTMVTDQPINPGYNVETAGEGETISQAPLLGNDRLIGGVGFGIVFDEPLDYIELPLQLDSYVGIQYLVPRNYYEAYPEHSYMTDGRVLMAGASLTLRF
jgi:long-subunit fatty acid transport protein